MTSLRVVLYARVSTEEQADEGHSIDAQLRVLRELAARKGWRVVGEYVDAGYSGKTLHRPKMQALLGDAAQRAFDVIAVHKLDRFSRSISDTITTLTELKEIGVSLASATQPIDFTTPEGKLMLMMLAVFAEIYIDNLSAETKKGMEQRARKGLWNGHIPFGYAKNGDGNGLTFHPENIEGYRLAIRMCADGKRISEIMDTLNAQGYRSTSFRGVHPFSKDMLFHMLKNRFYLGQVQYKGEHMQGKHEPAIDLETWERAQRQMERRAAFRGDHHRRASRPYLLRGLAYCAECGNRLRGQISGDHIRYYRCPASYKGMVCSQTKNIRADRIEKQIGEIFMRLCLPKDWRERALELLGETPTETARQEKQRTNLEGQLERAKVLFQLGDITEQHYRAERDRLRREIQELRPVQTFDLERAANVLQNFGELWSKANSKEQEDITHALIDRVYTSGGKIVTIEPKADFYPLIAIAAREAGLEVADKALPPPSPMSNTSAVLVIMPPAFYHHYGVARADEAKSTRKNKTNAPRVTRKRDPRARTHKRRNANE